MSTNGLYGNSGNGAVVAVAGAQTGGLYGDSPTGAVVAGPDGESAGLYGQAVVYGGTYFEWSIFYVSPTQPATPTNGSWNFETNVGTLPSGWLMSPPSNPTSTVWVSISIVNSRNENTLTWSTPGLYFMSGYSGISGYSGFSGISGYSGFSGISGYSGFSGISGFSGFSGFSGISGYSGSGVSGYSGYSGFSGRSGYSGSGVSGYSGFSGFSGISGFNGSGISGFSGYSGFSGISGYSGSGVSGWSGYSGYSGISGFSGSGVSGYSGYSGLGYYGLTATGSNSLSLGSKSFTTNLDASTTAFTVGQYIRVFATSVPSQYMEGLITAFTGTSLTVNMTYVSGGASFTNWTITASGVVGTSGYSGYSGISGYSGYSGSGVSGYSGYSGSGISGFSGYSGINGASGYSGISGYSGSGVSGYSGYSGISGYSGATPNLSSPPPIGNTTPNTGAFTSLTDSGNLTFTGTGNRITGDFSNATYANRVLFQSSVTNGNTFLGAIPNGTGAASALILNSSSDSGNSSTLITRVGSDTGVAAILSSQTGTGTNLPMTFYTGGSERVRIDTSGNVGIGVTSTSGYKLAVGGTGLKNQFINTDANNAYLYTDGSSYIGTTGAFNNVFITNNTERMRIDSSGNVGIGTSSPNAKLDVVVNTAVTTYAQVWDIYNGATFQFTNILGGDATNGCYFGPFQAVPLRLITNNTERARIDSSGNVGIANTSMGQKLAVNGGIQTNGTATLGTGYGGGAVLSFENPISRMYFGDGTGYSLAFSKRASSTTTDLMTLTDYGNVGIGTASPATKLNVVDSGTGPNTLLVQSGQTGTTPRSNPVFRLQTTATGRDVNIQFSDNVTNSAEIGLVGGPLYFATGGSERMRIDSSGNLLVGTTTNSFTSRIFVVPPSGGSSGSASLGVQAYNGQNGIAIANQSGTATYNGIIFSNNGGSSFVASVQVFASSVAYNTSSDARLKKNVVDAPNSLDLVNSVKVRSFDWINTGDHQRFGMVAQELQEVFPEVVNNQMDKNNTLGIDYSKLTPMLFKAIQELNAKFEEYKASHP